MFFFAASHYIFMTFDFAPPDQNSSAAAAVAATAVVVDGGENERPKHDFQWQN